jgi:hypothetical protein
MTRQLGFVVLLATVLAIPLAVAAEVNVNINVGPPPVIFAEPPRVVVVPQTPVYYAPDTTYNVFLFEGRYYSFYNGGWFVAVSHRGPWTFVPVERVPRPVLAVPARYYRMPPHHAKRHGGDRDEDHDRGEGHGKGCPPGLAKQGRC